MRQLQKGDQGPRRRDHRRIRLASVLILRTLRKADHRVPEEMQASSACQDDWVVARSRFRSTRPQLTRSLFSFTAFFEWTVARRRFTGSWCLLHIESVRIFSLPHFRRLHIRACPFLFQQDRTTGSRIWNRPGLPIGREHRDGIGRIHPQLLDQ